MGNLVDNVVNQLRDIADRADKERLSVWFEQFKIEFPVLHAQLVEARKQPTPEMALAFLIAKDFKWAGLKLVRDHMRFVRFVHTWMNEKDNASLPALPPKKRHKKKR